MAEKKRRRRRRRRRRTDRAIQRVSLCDRDWNYELRDHDHDRWPRCTLGLVCDPSFRLRDRGIIAERALRVIIVLFEAVLSRGITSCRAGIAVVACVGLVVRIVSITMALHRIRAGAVVVASREVAKVVVCDLLTSGLLRRDTLSLEDHTVRSIDRSCREGAAGARVRGFRI